MMWNTADPQEEDGEVVTQSVKMGVSCDLNRNRFGGVEG